MRPSGRRAAATALTVFAALAISASPALAAKQAKKLGKVKIAIATVTSAGDSQPITATATCPSGRKAVGGGWSETPVGGGPLAIVNVFRSLRGTGESWTTTARTGARAGIALTTLVYCRKLAKPILDATATAATPAATGGAASATAQCPVKRKLISGGFESSQGTTADRVSYPLASFASGGGWTYIAQNNASSSQTLTSHAYCAKGIKSARFRNHNLSQTVPFNFTLSTTTPACENQKKPRMAAGGFSNSSNTGAIPFPIVNRFAGPSWLVTIYNIAVDQFYAVNVQGVCLQP